MSVRHALKAVITAGGPIDGEFAVAAATSLKALAPVRGETMLSRTIAALRAAGADRIAVVGNDLIRDACGMSIDRIVDDTGSGSGNVLAALSAWEDDGTPLLYLTCDMPYVSAPALRSFLDRTGEEALSMPLSEHDAYVARFPGAPEAGIALGGERVVNGGAFHIPAGSTTRIGGFATKLFEARKAPWKMASIAGPALLAQFIFGRLTIVRLEQRAQEVLEMPVCAVRGCAPELGFDCDTLEDFQYANAYG